ncbi:MAG TPA: TIM barrel protein [Tepidisphaeraceae bacterium]|nr:TIM barrel protein [Tepidisphaeraceae bacterium]
MTRGSFRQSVCRWCFAEIPLETLARHAAEMGLAGIDLVEPADWPILKRFGLVCTMTPTHAIECGLNDPGNHAGCLEKIAAAIEATSAAGFPNVICFSGNCDPAISHSRGLENCAAALRKIVPLAQKKNVTLCMELLNSKLDHPGYMCDRSGWGAELAQRINSPNFKLLFDIYHMQVQEGDICATIRKHADYIGHYHTAGVPGRHEIDDSQELNYRAIMRTIAESGFGGFVAHEFRPTGEAIESLRRAVKLCEV